MPARVHRSAQAAPHWIPDRPSPPSQQLPAGRWVHPAAPQRRGTPGRRPWCAARCPGRWHGRHGSSRGAPCGGGGGGTVSHALWQGSAGRSKAGLAPKGHILIGLLSCSTQHRRWRPLRMHQVPRRSVPLPLPPHLAASPGSKASRQTGQAPLCSPAMPSAVSCTSGSAAICPSSRPFAGGWPAARGCGRRRQHAGRTLDVKRSVQRVLAGRFSPLATQGPCRKPVAWGGRAARRHPRSSTTACCWHTAAAQRPRMMPRRRAPCQCLAARGGTTDAARYRTSEGRVQLLVVHVVHQAVELIHHQGRHQLGGAACRSAATETSDESRQQRLRAWSAQGASRRSGGARGRGGHRQQDGGRRIEGTWPGNA
jgi:hypothetical protein